MNITTYTTQDKCGNNYKVSLTTATTSGNKKQQQQTNN